MNVVTALTDRSLRTALGYMLRDAGAEVHHANGPDGALVAVQEHRPDVLLAADDIFGGPLSLVDGVKGDAKAFRTAVVIVGDKLSQEEVLEAMERGADDVLRNPLDGADVVARTFAASRTKALVEELTAQNERLEELVSFDELTGLRNRRAILHELETLLAGARRHGHLVAVCMLDVDRFKTINDTAGHRAGDEVLQEVSLRIERRLRRADVAGRLGGDELLVVLPDTDGAGAETLAHEIVVDVAGSPVVTSAGPIAVSVSVGVAAWTGEGATDLLERADGALYAAKAAGRGRAAAA